MSGEYNPNTQGWPFAGMVCLLALGLLFFAYTTHEKNYLHPRNPMNQQVFHAEDAAKAEHGGEAKHEAKTEPAAEGAAKH